MQSGVVSSSTLFDPRLNPGNRLDTNLGLTLAAIEEGRLELLRNCFDGIFNWPRHRREWYAAFRKVRSMEAAEALLLRVYGIKDAAGLPSKFRHGMRALLRKLLSEELENIQAQQQELQQQAAQLQQILQS